MKDLFPGYYHKPDFKKLFNECIFVLDSNVLLSVYELPRKDTENLLSALENDKIFGRLWIPHQVALEYQRNRWKSIKKQENTINVTKRLNELTKSIENLADDLKKLSMLQHEYIDPDYVSGELKRALQIVQGANDHNKLNLLLNDKIRDRIDELFKGKIGSEYSEVELEEIYDEGKKRFKNKIPPGYEDGKTKDTVKKYGDLVLWKQILKHAKSNKKSIIFVTNEKKGDWWFKGDTNNFLGPQAELIQEFSVETGQIFHMYRINEFLKHIKDYLEIAVEEDTLKHVENILKRDEFLERWKIKPESLNKGEIVFDSNTGDFEIGINVPDSDHMVLVAKVMQELIEEFEGYAPAELLFYEMADRYDMSKEMVKEIIKIFMLKKIIYQSARGNLKFFDSFYI